MCEDTPGRTHCPSGDINHIEAWKSVVDFNKTVISLASAILTGFVGYYVITKPELGDSKLNFLPPVLLVIAISLAIYGYGRAIYALSKSEKSPSAVLFSNLSVVFLLSGIVSLPVIEIGHPHSLDSILGVVRSESGALGLALTPENMKKLSAEGSVYRLHYSVEDEDIVVTYSTDDRRIIGVSR